MCKAESKGRVFRAGIIAAVIVALAGLSACNGFVMDDIAEQNAAAELPVVNPDGTVNVKVALLGAGDGRSVVDGLVQAYVDYYEVIFKVHNGTTYYTGTAVDGEEYLSVAVEPDKSYDILLLAGTLANRVLLATGFVDDTTGKVGTGTGSGYPVRADKPNVIYFTMKYTNITPDEISGPPIVPADLTLGTNSTGTYKRNTSTKGIATIEVTATADGKDLIIAFDGGAKLEHLVFAEAGTSVLTFESNKVTLSPLYTTDPFQVHEEDGVVDPGDVAKYTYTIDKTKLPNNGAVRDVDGKLKWELTYYAFGDVASNSSKWNIRNGLDYRIDDNASGGSIRVKFGTGTPDLKKVIINY
jgi:hypothetical protein